MSRRGGVKGLRAHTQHQQHGCPQSTFHWLVGRLNGTTHVRTHTDAHTHKQQDAPLTDASSTSSTERDRPPRPPALAGRLRNRAVPLMLDDFRPPDGELALVSTTAALSVPQSSGVIMALPMKEKGIVTSRTVPRDSCKSHLATPRPAHQSANCTKQWLHAQSKTGRSRDARKVQSGRDSARP